MRVLSDRRSKVPSERRRLETRQIRIFSNTVRGGVIDLSAFKGGDSYFVSSEDECSDGYMSTTVERVWVSTNIVRHNSI